MEYKVYELLDQEGAIVYVGMSSNPESRFYAHTKHKPTHSGSGYFYGRTDLSIRVYSIHPTRKEALKAEGARKLELGFEWSEREVVRKIGKKNVDSGHWERVRHLGNRINQEKIACEYCGTVANRLMHGRWHGPKCKKNLVLIDQ
jgi:predicted GIY-YIG superfamily endonuclease